jgi:hypothetical protein
VRRSYLVGVLLAATFKDAAAQQLPFTITIVDWQREVLLQQVMAYRAETTGREVMFCVDGWTTLPADRGIERIVISSVHRERTGDNRRIHDIGDLCVGPKGEALPMIHTHSDGNCQFSPVDLVTVVARRAPFDGVQCGDHHFVWAFAWQVLAIANSVELAKLKPRY